MHSWFRFYNSVPDDPKIGQLSDANFRQWVHLLCIASRFEGLIPGDVESLAYTLRKPRQKVAEILQALVSASLLERCADGFRPHNWEQRQFKSDVSTERVKRFRKRFKPAAETANETPPDSETETDHRQMQKEDTSLRSVARTKATRWPSDQLVSEDWRQAAGMKRVEHGLVGIDIDLEAVKFQNFWAGKSGQNATKVDWQKTWINWALKAEAPRHGNGKHPSSAHSRFIEGVGEYIAEQFEGKPS